jgi:hypothetical protein
MTDFEMVVENDNSFVIKKIYPENYSKEEIEKAERDSPKVILHCFDPEKVLELQQWGEKIAQQHLELHGKSSTKKVGLIQSIKSFLG